MCSTAGSGQSAALRDGQVRPRACRPLDGDGQAPAEFANLKELMQRALNPRLSHLTVLLFHDARDKIDDQRNDEIASDAQGLADCFALIGSLGGPTHKNDPDFAIYETLGRHNALSLLHASYLRDRLAQEHWFTHIKETCQACHAQYRNMPAASGGVAQ